MRTNVRQVTQERTYEGGKAVTQRPELKLERMVASCLLYEDTFYAKGVDIADRIAALCEKVSAEKIAGLAIRAREELYLRHVPLFLCRHLARLHKGRIVGDTITRVVRRADELGEMVSLYWREKRQPLSAQVERGLRLAFPKFSKYALAKYDREAKVKLRDVLFLVHAKPKDEAQAAVWKKLVDGTLEAPDTWEVALSAGADKKATWERLLTAETTDDAGRPIPMLGYLALLRNLRNMTDAGVDSALVGKTLVERASSRAGVLPSQFVAAYRFAPSHAEAIQEAFLKSVSKDRQALPGRTAIVVDVSGSMDAELSGRSKINRIDAAAALAMLAREVADEARVFTFSNKLVEVANLRGFAMLEAIHRSQQHGGTWLGQALATLQTKVPNLNADRVIVVTDEQAHDGMVPAWTKFAYLINVGPYQPGLDVSQGWTRISGWSDRIIEWIALEEKLSEAPNPAVAS